MSSFLTAFLLLYVISLHVASPIVKPERCVAGKVTNTASTDRKTSEHDEINRSNHADWYNCDAQNSATTDHHDLSEAFNMPSYHSKVLKRKKRMTVDTYGSAKEGWFIMKGRYVEVPCFTTGRRAPKWPEFTKFKWFDVNNKPVANSRYKNHNDGWLKISETEISDTGKYKCNIVGMDKKIQKTVSPVLKVFILPTLYLQIKLYYEPKSCSVDSRKQDRNKVRGFLCEKGTKCQYNITSKCKVATTKSGPVLGKSKSQHVVTAVKYMPSTYVPPHCKPKCMVNVIKKHLDEDKASALKKIPIGRKPSQQKFHIKKQCSAGFTIYKEMLCLPCGAGTYSNAGDDVCTPCGRGHYQPELGRSKCNKCPKGRYTLGKGSASLSLCKAPHKLVMSMTVNTMNVEHYAVIGAVPVIIILTIIICCCAKRSKKKPKKKDKLLKSEDEEVHRPSKVGFESDLGASTEMETDFKTEQSSTGSEGEQTKNDSDESVSKGRGSSRKSGKKRNVNNSHRLLGTSNSSVMLEKFTCSEPLVDTSTTNLKYISMGGLQTECNVQQNSPRKFQQSVEVETNNSPSRLGKKLAARLSIVDTSVSSPTKPEPRSVNYAKQMSSVENNCLNNSLPFLSFDDVEVEEVHSPSTENSETNYKPISTSTTLDSGHSEKITYSKDQTRSFQISALQEVPKSMRITTQSRMATYNNPACLPKPVTISRYSEAAIRDLFPVSLPNTQSSTTPEVINMAELSHRKSNTSAHTDPETYALGHQITLGSQIDSGSVSGKHSILENPSTVTLCAPNTDQECGSTETSTLSIDTQSSGYTNSSCPQISARSDIPLQPGSISYQLSSQSKELFNSNPNQRTFRKDSDCYKMHTPNETSVPLPPGSFNYLLPKSQATKSIPPFFMELNSATATSKSQSHAISPAEKAGDEPEASPVPSAELRKMMTQRYGIPLPSSLQSQSANNKATDIHKTPPTPPPLPSSHLSIGLEPTKNTNKRPDALTQERSSSHVGENASHLHRTDNARTCIVSDTLEKLMLTMPQVGEAKITGPSSNSSNGKETSLTMSSNSGESQ